MKKILQLLLAALPIFVAAQTVPSYVPTNGLAAWYSFTGNANDESGGGNNGTPNGATLTSGKQSISNTAYSFDGLSNTIDLPNPFLGGGQVNSFTFHVLLNLNTLNSYHMIWSKTLFWGEVSLDITNQNAVRFAWANSITGNKYSTIYSQANIIQAGQWYDIVVVFQNSSGQIYLNGNPISTNLQWTAQGGSVISTTQIESSCNFAQNAGSSIIGSYLNSNYLNGKIDEFGVWSVALTPTQITNLFLGQDCQTSVTTQPVNQSVSLGNTAQFSLTSSNTNANYQWQQNNGTGFINLSNFGQFSGVNTATLSISGVTASQNNNGYRCIISSGNCSDTSAIAILTVNNDVGITEFQNSNLLTIFPNPAKEIITMKTDASLVGKQYNISDYSGKLILTGVIKEEKTNLTLSNLSAGLYTIAVDNNKYFFNIIKE